MKTFTGDPLALADYGPLYAQGRPPLRDRRHPAGQGTVVVVRFKGVDDRNTAEALTGTELFVDRAALPADATRTSSTMPIWSAWRCQDETGATIGKVTAVQNFGGGDILELKLGRRQGRADPVHPGRRAGGRRRRRVHPDRQRRRRTWSTTRTATASRTARRPAAASIQSAAARPEGCRRQPVTLPRHGADALSGNVSGRARPVAGRPGAGRRRPGRWSRCRSATSPPTGTAPSTTRRPAAAPAW